MRKTITAFLATAVLVLLTASCEWGRTKTGGQTDSLDADAAVQELTFIQVRYADSVQLKGEGSVILSLKAEWPNAKCQSVLADSIRRWLADLMPECALPQWNEDEGKITKFEGDITDGQALVAHYGRQGMNAMMAEVREAEADSFPVFGMENSLEVKVECNTDSFITLTYGYYVYTGGAHGGYLCGGASFNKADGRQLGWNVIDLSKKDQLIALIREGLKEYFEVKTDAELEEQLQLFDDPDTPVDESASLPLPQTEPYLTDKGVVFIYQQYEIACYAAGLPTCVIPFEKIPMLK